MADKLKMVTTRQGDEGETSMYDGTIVRKDFCLIDALGELDELNSWLSLIRLLIKKELKGSKFDLVTHCVSIQDALGRISTAIAATDNAEASIGVENDDEALVDSLEKIARELVEVTEIGRTFSRVENSELAAQIDIVRTICRRAERRVVSYDEKLQHPWLSFASKYLNRLSDYLFILSRYVDQV